MELSNKDFEFIEIKEPEFVKDFNYESDENTNLLLSLMDYATKDMRIKIEKELHVIKNSFLSEKNVYNEIKKSRLPFICLHDIRLEHRGLDIEFDFIVIAKEFILMIETKPYIGNITINFKNEVIRDYPFKNERIKEPILSKVVKMDQNIKFLERFLKDNKLVKDIPLYTIAVIGSDDSKVKTQFAKSKVKKLFIHYSELIDQMNVYIKNNQTLKLSQSQMREISAKMLQEHKPVQIDYLEKFNLKTVQDDSKYANQNHTKSKDKPEDPSEALLYKTLKDARKDLYRNEKSGIFRGYKKQ